MYMYPYPVVVSQVHVCTHESLNIIYMYMWVTIPAHMGDAKLIAATLEIYLAREYISGCLPRIMIFFFLRGHL